MPQILKLIFDCISLYILEHFSADDIPSEPDHILDAIAAYDTGDESDDWEDSPRQPQSTFTSSILLLVVVLVWCTYA